MANTHQRKKYDSPSSRANLARSYRAIAEMMPFGINRDRLLRMAHRMDAKSIEEDETQATPKA